MQDFWIPHLKLELIIKVALQTARQKQRESLVSTGPQPLATWALLGRRKCHVVVNVAAGRKDCVQLHRAVGQDGPLHACQGQFAPARVGA